MSEASKEFRDSLAKEMRTKIEERNEKLKDIDGQGLTEDVKAQTKKNIMDTFYKEIDEMKSRPGYKEAREEHLKEIQEKIKGNNLLLEELRNAKTIEKRVKLFVLLVDKLPLDAIVGLIPGGGDVAMSVVSSILLVHRGCKVKLPWRKIGLIIGFQAMDAIIGMIGLTDTLGNVADYIFMANGLSSIFFTRKVEELKAEAVKRGINPKRIQKATQELEQESKTMKRVQPVFENIFNDLYTPKGKK